MSKDAVKPAAVSGAVVPMPGPDAKKATEALEVYGDLIPYGDPGWYQSVSL